MTILEVIENWNHNFVLEKIGGKGPQVTFLFHYIKISPGWIEEAY